MNVVTTLDSLKFARMQCTQIAVPDVTVRPSAGEACDRHTSEGQSNLVRYVGRVQWAVGGGVVPSPHKCLTFIRGNRAPRTVLSYVPTRRIDRPESCDRIPVGVVDRDIGARCSRSEDEVVKSGQRKDSLQGTHACYKSLRGKFVKGSNGVSCAYLVPMNES